MSVHKRILKAGPGRILVAQVRLGGAGRRKDVIEMRTIKGEDYHGKMSQEQNMKAKMKEKDLLDAERSGWSGVGSDGERLNRDKDQTKGVGNG